MYHDGNNQCTGFVIAVADEAGYKLKGLKGGTLKDFEKAAKTDRVIK
jgi:hypothetical protein